MNQLFGGDADRMSESNFHSRLSSTEAILPAVSEWCRLIRRRNTFVRLKLKKQRQNAVVLRLHLG